MIDFTARITIAGVDHMSIQEFQASLTKDNIVNEIRDGLIGNNISIPTPFGMKPMIYADYTASGRALRQIEDFVAEKILPYYANSHTESSFCGAYMTKMRNEARQVIASETNAGEEYSVIFSGSGATSAINRLVALCGVADAGKEGNRPVVFVGPYEHHSNILPWRESGAEVIEIDEAENGGPDLKVLENALIAHSDRPAINRRIFRRIQCHRHNHRCGCSDQCTQAPQCAGLLGLCWRGAIFIDRHGPRRRPAFGCGFSCRRTNSPAAPVPPEF